MRNIMAHWLMALLVLLVSGAAAVVTVVATATDVSKIESAHAMSIERGRDVWRLHYSSWTDARFCESLNKAPGVLNAGTVLGSGTARFPDTPVAVDLTVATPGFIRIFWPEANYVGSVIVGSAAAQDYGARIGRPIEIKIDNVSGNAPIDQVMVKSPRNSALDGRVFTVSPPLGQVRDCYLEAKPGERGSAEAYLSTLDSDSVSISPLYVPEDTGETSDQILQRRMTIWVSTAACVVVLCVNAILVQSRRREWALYRVLRASPADLLGLQSVEALVTIWSPALVGTLLGMALVPAIFESELVLVHVFADSARFLTLTLLAPLLTVFLTYRTKALEVLKGA